MYAETELRYHRRNTLAFISTSPVLLTLVPRLKVTDGAGTKLVDQPPRAAQKMRLLDQSTSRNTWPGTVQTSDGREVLTDFILLAAHDAIVETWDYWTDASGKWEVAELFPFNGYEVRAKVVRRRA